MTQQAWGCNSSAIPAWQRYVVIAIFPVLCVLVRKAFRVSDARYAKSVEHIETILADIETRLGDGQTSILGGESIDYVDITFASISALWLQPEGYGRGKADLVRFKRDCLPPAMRNDVERWIEKYPVTTAFINRLYEQER